MPALSFDYAGFGAFLRQPVSKLSIDLSNSDVCGVLTEYERFKRMSNNRYSLSPVIYQIRQLERDYNTQLLPMQISDVFWSMWFARLNNIGLLPSTIKNYFDNLRAALTWGTRHNLRVSPTYDQYDVSRFSRIHPALTPDEVSLIAHYDIRAKMALDLEPYRKAAEQWVDDYCSKKDRKWHERIDAAISKGGKNITDIKRKYEKHFVSSKQKKELFEMKFKGFSASARANREKLIDTMERVRDQFVIQCNLGQRYSDIVRLSPSNFSADRKTYRVTQQKTGGKAVVDISSLCFDKKVLDKLLDRYGYSAPYPHSINNFNHFLHTILQMIGGPFDEQIKSENKVRGEIIEESVPKWQAMASHTARRSFATLNIQRGISEVVVRHATGHLDSRSFQRYIIFDD